MTTEQAKSLVENAAARAREADAIVRELAARDVIEDAETFNGFYCNLCGQQAHYEYSGYDANEHARIKNAARDGFVHPDTCPYARAVAYMKGGI